MRTAATSGHDDSSFLGPVALVGGGLVAALLAFALLLLPWLRRRAG